MKLLSSSTNFPGLACGSAYIVISMDAGGVNMVQSYFRGELDCTTFYAGDECMLQVDIPFLLERPRQQFYLNRRLTVDESESMRSERLLAKRQLMQKKEIEMDADMDMDVFFPVQWRFGDCPGDGIGGPDVDDAGTIFVTRYDDYDEELVKKTTLTEMIAKLLKGWTDSDGYTDEAHVPASDALAAALRAAADMLDAGTRPNVPVSHP